MYLEMIQCIELYLWCYWSQALGKKISFDSVSFRRRITESDHFKSVQGSQCNTLMSHNLPIPDNSKRSIVTFEMIVMMNVADGGNCSDNNDNIGWID